MYLDLVVVLVIAVIGLIKYKKASSYVYLFCVTDMSFRVLSFLNSQVKIEDINGLISKYVPSSIYDVIVNYTSDLLETCLIWGYVIIYIFFIYFTFRILLKKR